MNRIIGTAGHVDHGKSALIYALTGLTMMRLPEEKRREMTIDLGFGFFEPKESIKIGVIDVPGHERFIRNMVAGMWSLDLVMLVVCANEGWMEMTEEHAKVAASLGIKNIICVINKIDLVNEEILNDQEKKIKEHLLKMFKRDIETVRVSATKNINIDNLKNRVADILLKDSFVSSNKPYIYVDRVFSIKGAGLTITGSLKDGSVKREDTLIHYPSGKEVHVRAIQSYHTDKEEVEATSRIALNIKNIKKEDIRRGHLLCSKDCNIFSTKEIILELTSDGEYLKKIKNAEFAIGTECVVADVIPLYKKNNKDEKNDIKTVFDRRFIRLRFEEEISVFWKERGILISHGGSNIIGAGYVFWALETTPIIRKNIMENASDFLGDISKEKYRDLVMSVMRFIPAKDELPEYAIKMDSLYVKKDYVKYLLDKIDKLFNEIKKENISFDDIKTRLYLNDTFVKPFIDYLVQSKILMPFNNGYKKYTDNIALTNSQKAILDKLKKEDLNGLEERNIKLITNGMKDIKTITALKYAVYLEDGIYYHAETYRRIKSVILKNSVSKDIISISYVKDKTGLSRKYVIPILNAMEREKLLKRHGNDRIVI